LLLVGFGGALRRSELVALDVADIAETETGLLVTVRGSKTDQERAGATIAIARGDVACPANALREWLDAAGIEDGPIFRPIDKGGTVRPSRLTDRSVANIVKAYAERAGFDASAFSGHSLRAGFLTSAAGKGASFKMMDVSRHKSVDTLRATSVMRSYSRIMREPGCCEAGSRSSGACDRRRSIQPLPNCNHAIEIST
jgi:integrase